MNQENITFSMEDSIERIKHYFDMIKRYFPEYEERISQKKMIWSILKGYEGKEHIIVEAPTGTGKSLAYILPFLSVWEQFETDNKPKLVIATNTIALQEQLITKDIPTLKKILKDIPFTTALVKGKSNYLCLNRIQPIIQDKKAIFETIEEAKEFKELLNLIANKKSDNDYEILIGDRSALKTTISNNLWNKINVEPDTCRGTQCPLFKECFYFKAKKELINADILVTNHALFFADLSVRINTDFELDNVVLPSYNFLVFDEAHHLEDVSSDFLGSSVSRFRFKVLATEIKKHVMDGNLSEQISTQADIQIQIVNLANSLEMEVDELFRNIVNFLENSSKDKIITTKRLLLSDKRFVNINNINKILDELKKYLSFAKTLCEFSEEEEVFLDALSSRINLIQYELNFIVEQQNEDYVYWIESPNRDNRHYFTSLETAPISVSDVLKDNLFNKLNSVVLTSATMGTSNMSYIASRLGIENYNGSMFHSPFDYKKQSTIYVPLKSVNPKSTNEFEPYIEEEILKIIEVSKGRSLVLFTSYSLMDKMAHKFEPVIKQMGYTFLKQGNLPRTPLINTFKEDIHSVLFATSSYWEGIDVPGESLSAVIITKLPFEVPDRPVIEARVEKLQKEGKNPFIHYHVPNAVMKFKQGFGRLIRTSTDKGVVAVLDDRILKMHYGKEFINSLPPIPITRNIDDIRKVLEE